MEVIPRSEESCSFSTPKMIFQSYELHVMQPLPAVDGHGHQCTVFEYDATINNKSVRGRPFVVDARALSNIGFPIDLGEDVSQDDVHDFVIVIAADYNVS